MEELIALQNNLGLGHLGDVIITTQARMDENKPCIATLSGDEIGAAMSLIERWNGHDTLKAKAELFDEMLVAYRVKFEINDSRESLMRLVNDFTAKAKEIK